MQKILFNSFFETDQITLHKMQILVPFFQISVHWSYDRAVTQCTLSEIKILKYFLSS